MHIKLTLWSLRYSNLSHHPLHYQFGNVIYIIGTYNIFPLHVLVLDIGGKEHIVILIAGQ